MSALQNLQQEIILAEAKVNELREKLTQQKNSERLETIASIKALVKLHQLSANDLGLIGKKRTAPNKIARVDKGTSVAPKYSDPVTGKTWAGRGRVPSWLAEYLAAGNGKEAYLISNV